MHCVKQITQDMYWVGGSDRRLALFENVYPIPNGVSYNAYLVLDEQTVLFDTVDRSVSEVFFENIDHLLAGRKLDILVVNHMEPDHCATMSELVLRHPEVKIYTNAKALNMGAGNVGVYLLLASDTGAAAIMQSVLDALSAEDVRPLTDNVSVYRAEDVAYTLNVRYASDNSSATSAAIAAAVSDYQTWQDQVIGRAFNPDRLMAAIYQAGATRVTWGDGSNFNGGAVTYTEIGASQRCKGTITLTALS